MAAVGSIQKGTAPEYYTQVSKGPEYYSAGAGIEGLDPEGVWTGRGCPELGLAVDAAIDKGVFLELYGKHTDPRTGDRLGRAMPKFKTTWREIYAGLAAVEPEATAERRHELEVQAKAQVRTAVPYFDATFSPGKDVSLLHASFMAAKVRAEQRRDAEGAADCQRLADMVWAAVTQGNQAWLDHLQDHAGYTRAGSHARKVGQVSTGRWEDAHAFVVASFRQHTSRNGDPQLHVHNTILNSVQRERDGEWRTLDGAALFRERGAAAAAGALVMENALARDLGVEFVMRADGHGRDIRGIGERLIDAFSTRTREDIEGRLPELIEAYRHKFGREPDARALRDLRQRANLDTRARKESELSLERHVREWAERARRTDGEALEPIGRQVCSRLQGVPAPEPGPPLSLEAEQNLMRVALARVGEKNSTWTRSGLTRALGELLPVDAAVMGGREAKAYLQGLTARALAGEVGEVVPLAPPEFPEVPAVLCRSDGESVFRPHYATRYATGLQLSMEERIVHVARQAGSEIPSLSLGTAAQLLGSTSAALVAQLDHEVSADVTTVTGSGLHLDQAAAAFKILTSSRRAEVLIGPAGTGKTRTVATLADCWQAAYPGGRVIGLTTSQQARNVLVATGVADSFNIAKFLASPRQQAIPENSLVILDEASMIAMQHFDAVLSLARAAGAKVVVTGDPHQLGAVEGGGGMLMLARELGHVQLGEPMRFREAWEREATLRMRAGDVSVLGEYERHGRLRYGTKEEMTEQAYRAWLADCLAGTHSVLIAHEQADADEMSRRARGDLKHFGMVAGGGEVALRDHAVASGGDRIMARQNDGRIRPGVHGRGLANRDVLRVDSTDGDGSAVVRLLAGRAEDGTEQWGDPFTLSRKYLTEHCHLAYAVTAHSAEGSTFDGNGYSLVRPQDTREYAYTAMSRARGRNVAYVVGEAHRAGTDGGPEPDPEIGRHRMLEAGRAGTATDAGEELDGSAITVLAGVLERSEHELSATETRAQEFSNEDHLGQLGVRWLEFVKEETTSRFSQALLDLLPADLAADALADRAATWLWRSLRQAELSGLDAAALLAEAVNQQDMSGVRDVARVIDARVRRMLDGTEPIITRPWAERACQLADPEVSAYWRRIGEAMDARTVRLGEHTARTAPLWATRGLGPVPEEAAARQDWERRAAAVAAYREMWGYESPGDPIGPAPSKRTPEARAAWRLALTALGEIDGIDLRHLDDGSLLLRRGTYERETERAPEYVAAELRLTMRAGDGARERAVRAEFEAQAATDAAVRARHREQAGLWRQLEAKAGQERAAFAAARETRAAWDEITGPTRRVALAADVELRRRHPGMQLDPLRSGEPEPVTAEDDQQGLAALGLTLETVAEPVPDRVWQVQQAARDKQEDLDEIRSMPEPADEDDELSPGEAWGKVIGRQRDSVLQPGVEPIPLAPEIAGKEDGKEADQ